MPWSNDALAFFGRRQPELPDPARALPGRDTPLPGIPEIHAVNGHRIQPPFPEHLQTAVVAMGCFWGAERHYWELDGVWSTAVGYCGGFTPNPTYDEVCSGRTGHTESVLVVFDPQIISTERIFAEFWEHHDPTQGMRQGNDVGTQYRSAVFTTDEDQAAAVRQTRLRFQTNLAAAGYGAITTEIASLAEAGPFYYAEALHQQYLHKNPGGYCPIHATGVSCLKQRP
jgi:peptide-methionine (S)-S-oxide reductase